MSKKRILIIAEGPTDLLLLDEITKEFYANSLNEIEFIPVIPEMDLTSQGSYKPAGWTVVRSWCLEHQKEKRNLNHNPTIARLQNAKRWDLIMALRKADGMIIHIDSDIAEKIVDLPCNYDGSQNRKDFCKNAILYWLNESITPNNHHYLLATMMTETWLLATKSRHDTIFSDLPSSFNFEDIDDVLERLVRFGYTRGRNRFNKEVDKYKGEYSNLIIGSLDNVIEECEALKDYRSYLYSMLPVNT